MFDASAWSMSQRQLPACRLTLLPSSRWGVLFCVIETFFLNVRKAIDRPVFFDETTHEGDYHQSHHE